MYQFDKVRIRKGGLSIEMEGPNVKLAIRAICFALICVGIAAIISANNNNVRYIG
jgi:hypothetical protein